jgi:hypothetical protein
MTDNWEGQAEAGGREGAVMPSIQTRGQEATVPRPTHPDQRRWNNKA